MRDAADIFRGRYVLLVSDDKERTLLLSRALQQREANVGIRRADGLGVAGGTELVLVDVRHGSVSEAEQKARQSDPQLRLASVCAVDFRSVVTERGSVRLGLLEGMVAPLISRDLALVEQAQRESAFVYELASLGPTRTLRALCRAGTTLYVSIAVTDAPIVHGSLTLSGELIVAAFLESDDWHEEGWRALARIIELRRGRLSISRVEHPSAMNIMEPLDVALDHAEQVRKTEAGFPRESVVDAAPANAPVVAPLVAPSEIDADEADPIELVRRRPDRRAVEQLPIHRIDGMQTVTRSRRERDNTQTVLSQELSVDEPPLVVDAAPAELPTHEADLLMETTTAAYVAPAPSIPEAPFAGPRLDAQTPTPRLRPRPARRLSTSTLVLLVVVGAIGGASLNLVNEQAIAALAFFEQPAPASRPTADEPRQVLMGAVPSDERTPSAVPTEDETAALEPPAQPPHALVAAAQPLAAANAEPAPSEPSAVDLATTSTSSKELVDSAAKLLAQDPITAKRLYEAAVALDARNPHAFAGLGQALLALEQPDDAQKALETAVRLRAKRPSYRVLLGDALRMGGKLEEAREAWKKALELDPDDEEARERIDALDGDRG